MLLSLSILAVTVAFVVACWLTDVRTREIPNWLSFAAFVMGIVLNLLSFGGAGLIHSLAGTLVPVAILIGPFALGGIGGGDVKMMGAIGALLGPWLALNAVAAGLILGGIIMVLHLAGLGRLGEKLASTVKMLRRAWSTRTLGPLRLSDEHPAAVTLPYSVPLGLGTVAVLLPRLGSMGPLF
jgi:prepilin peptidase CpaA